MMRAFPAILALVALTGCDLLFPEDPRLGIEDESACAARIAQELRLKLAEAGGDDATMWMPTYTYDITKLSLEAIQALSASGFNETKGTRLNRATNETSTAFDVFMDTQVDENGAFFLGHEPALYRVRGETARMAEVIAAGCARQQENMRLIDIDLAPRGSAAPATPAPDGTNARDNETD
jgi:hypothetical protein